MSAEAASAVIILVLVAPPALAFGAVGIFWLGLQFDWWRR